VARHGPVRSAGRHRDGGGRHRPVVASGALFRVPICRRRRRRRRRPPQGCFAGRRRRGFRRRSLGSTSVTITTIAVVRTLRSSAAASSAATSAAAPRRDDLSVWLRRPWDCFARSLAADGIGMLDQFHNGPSSGRPRQRPPRSPCASARRQMAHSSRDVRVCVSPATERDRLLPHRGASWHSTLHDQRARLGPVVCARTLFAFREWRYRDCGRFSRSRGARCDASRHGLFPYARRHRHETVLRIAPAV
jgi:hypothetical protein